MLAQANQDQNAHSEDDKTANLRFLAAELSDYAKGMKALEAGDLAAAQAASAAMDAGLWRGQQDQSAKDEAKKDEEKKKAGGADAKKDEAKQDKPVTEPILPDANPEPLMKCLGIASMELRAGIEVAQGKSEDAKKLYAAAIAQDKKAGYHEPPFYIRPVGENEAEALLRVKDYAGAKTAYESALDERPNSGFALYGLAHVKELQGDAAGAREAYAAFLKAWPAANADLPQLAHAKEMTGGSQVSTR